MVIFLKGDKTAEITLALADGFDYSGKTVHLEYQGVRRSFSNAVAGGTLTFSFSAAETAPMSLGTYPVRVWIEDAQGEKTTIHNSAAKFRVTDCATDIREGGAVYLDVRGGLYGIDGLPPRFTDNDLRDKVNEILRRLGGTVAMFLLCALPAFAASVTVQTAPKGEIYNDEAVVTNVTLDVSDLATSASLNDALDTANAAIATNAADIAANAALISANADAIATKADAEWIEATNDYWTVESHNRTLNGLVLTKDGEGSFWGLDPTVYNLEDMPSIIFGFYGDRWQYYDSIYVSTAFIDAPESAAYIEATTGFSSYSNTVRLTRHTSSITNRVVYTGKYDADHAALTKTLSNKADRFKVTRTLVDFNFYGMGHPRENFWHGEDDVVEPVIDDDPLSGFWDSRSRQVQWDLWWTDGVWRTRTYYSYWPDGEEEVISEDRLEASRETNGIFGHWRNPATEVWREETSEMIYSDSVDDILVSVVSSIEEEDLNTVGGIANILLQLKRRFEALKENE